MLWSMLNMAQLMLNLSLLWGKIVGGCVRSFDAGFDVFGHSER